MRQFRQLVQSFGGKKAVLLSTHILSEVEAVCDRLIIIHEGRKAADLPAAQGNLEEVFVEITTGVGKHKP